MRCGGARSAFQAALAKKAAALMLVAVLATTHVRPKTIPSITRAGATITVYNCQQTTQMRTELVIKHCGQPPAANQPTATTLVQQVVVQQSRGWVCKIKRSKPMYYCGLLSYKTEVRLIKFLHTQRVHPRDCCCWVHQQKFVDPERREEHQLSVPGVTNVQVATLGQGGNLRNKASCQGSIMSTANSIALSGLGVEVKYQVSVQPVQIKSIGEEVEAGAHHLPC